jgi:ribosomal protein L15
MGNKQSEKFFWLLFRGGHTMDKSLAKHGFHRDDVTDVL